MNFELTDEDLASGLARVQSIADSLDRDVLARTAQHPHGKTAAQQPWFIAGVSDGMGLHTAIAAIEAGVLTVGLGVFWEPPHFLDKNDDGEPVSPVHWARLQNAAALEKWAADKGIHFPVVSANVIMSPERDLRGNAKGEPNELEDDVLDAVEAVRAKAELDDLVFVNSVAFGKWMSPREGEEPIAVPTVDLQGRIIEMRTKKFHPRGYQETLDTMGRNHKLLLEVLRERGWLGPDSLTAFFTWAGGSQNVDVLEGIYGKGALGDAKVIAEADVAEFRLRHGLDLGAHAIVRLPAFLSAALMGIPGGGLFGLVSRAFLEERGLFEDMPTLAVRMLDRMFGPGWIRENPISQIELDTAETLYIEQISARVAEAQQRVYDYWSKHPEARDGAIELETSEQLLAGLAPDRYPDILRRFDPSAEPQPRTPSRTLGDDALSSSRPTGEFRPDLAMVEAFRSVGERIARRQDLVVHSERVEVDTDAWSRSSSVRTEIECTNGGAELVVQRSFFDQEGRALGKSTTTLAPKGAHPTPHTDTRLLGEAVGPRMPVRIELHRTFDADASLASVLQGPALIGFARENLKAAGVFDGGIPTLWDIRFAGEVKVGDHLLTYARRESEGWVVTVVDDDSRPLLQMSLR